MSSDSFQLAATLKPLQLLSPSRSCDNVTRTTLTRDCEDVMTCRISLRSLRVVIFAIGILQTSAAQFAQQEIAVEPPLLDKPLIFDSSTRGPGGTRISGPKF